MRPKESYDSHVRRGAGGQFTPSTPAGDTPGSVESTAALGPLGTGAYSCLFSESFVIQIKHFHKNRSMYDLERGLQNFFNSDDCVKSESIHSSLIIVWHIG